MEQGRFKTTVALSVVVFVMLGCHSGDSEPEKVWANEPVAYNPSPNSQNAFDAYALAALDAQTLAQSSIDRVFFFPDQKTEVSKKIERCVREVSRATEMPCQFKFVAHKPFKAPQYQSGWRLIGRVYQWNAETACTGSDFDTAIKNVVTGSKFGFDLTGGGATDASLGLAIVNNLRRVITSYLGKMTPAQLDRLAKGMKDALSRKPSLNDTLKNEHENMLQTLQYVANIMKTEDLKGLQQNMGPDVNEAVRYIDQIRSNPKKRQAFMTELSNECEEEFSAIQHDIGQPANLRSKPKTDFTGQWKKLPKHILGTSRPLLELSDMTLARTRLLILYAEIYRVGKQNKPYPTSLTSFTRELTIDPFSATPFLYHADQAEFSIYSVGLNGRDDGGDSDETFTAPDLRLENTGQ